MYRGSLRIGAVLARRKSRCLSSMAWRLTSGFRFGRHLRVAHPADVPATWADITKAGQLLGWEPRTHYEQGVENLVRWYHDNREWAKEINTT